MKLSFWPLLIGALAIIWGAAKLARYVLGINFPQPITDIYVWSTVAIVIDSGSSRVQLEKYEYDDPRTRPQSPPPSSF